jgi:hypothetical protein
LKSIDARKMPGKSISRKPSSEKAGAPSIFEWRVGVPEFQGDSGQHTRQSNFDGALRWQTQLERPEKPQVFATAPLGNRRKPAGSHGSPVEFATPEKNRILFVDFIIL